MSVDPKDYNLAEIQNLLVAAFNPRTLRRFLRDRPDLRPILDIFAPGHGMAAMADEVIDYCAEQVLFEYLLDEVKAVNLRQYKRFAGKLRLPAASRAAGQAQAAAQTQAVERLEALHGQAVELHEKLKAWLFAPMPIGIAPAEVDEHGLVSQVREFSLVAKKARVHFDDETQPVVQEVVQAITEATQALEQREMVPDWNLQNAAGESVDRIPDAIAEVEQDLRRLKGL